MIELDFSVIVKSLLSLDTYHFNLEIAYTDR